MRVRALSLALASLALAGVAGEDYDVADAASLSAAIDAAASGDASAFGLPSFADASDAASWYARGSFGDSAAADPAREGWREAWRKGVERAWSEAHTCPTHPGGHWEAVPESHRRILRVVSYDEYSGFNFPGGGETWDDRPYVFPPFNPPPPPPFPSPPPPEPPLPPFAPPPPAETWPPPPAPDPVSRSAAFRRAETDPVVDLFVGYLGVGAKFQSVRQYYYSLENSTALRSAYPRDADPANISVGSHRHAQLLDVPPGPDVTVYVRLAASESEGGEAVGEVEAVPVVIGSFLQASWGPGNGKHVEARTLYELVEGMRDETVEKITLRRHVELPPGNFSLPTIRDGRTLTVTGLCDAARWGNASDASSTASDASSTASESPVGGGRRRLAQVTFGSAYEDRYDGTYSNLTPEEARELRLLVARITAKIALGLYNQTAIPAPWPHYPSDIQPASNPDPFAPASTGVPGAFVRGTAFDAPLPSAAHAPGTAHAHFGPADPFEASSGPGMNVTANVVGSEVVNVTNATGHVVGTRVEYRYAVAPTNRCVVDGARASRLFAVGDPDAPDCAWPRPRPRRFEPAQAGTAPRAFTVVGPSSSSSTSSSSRGGSFASRHVGLASATAGVSPWGGDAHPRRTAGDAGRRMRRVDDFVSANHTASSPGASSVDPALAVDPSDPGFARPASRRCGRLTLENLVLRGGFAEEAPGAAAIVRGGELRATGCVVEGHRTGRGAGRGGAVANLGGVVDVARCVFRDNVAGRGRDGDGADDLEAVPTTGAGNHVYSASGSRLRIDRVTTFDDRFGAVFARPVVRQGDEVGV
jgi:hypothetical protein